MKALNHSSQTAKSNEGHSLGEMLNVELITPNNLKCWITSAKQDLAVAPHVERAYLLGQIFAYGHILDVLENGF